MALRADLCEAQDDSTVGGLASDARRDSRKKADDWLTIWQSELNALIVDPELDGHMVAFTSFWRLALTEAALASSPKAGAEQHEHETRSAGSNDATRTPPRSAALDPREDEIGLPRR